MTKLEGRGRLIIRTPTASGSAPLRGYHHFATLVAEGVGFEPTVPVRAHRFSRPALSSTQPPLRYVITL